MSAKYLLILVHFLSSRVLCTTQFPIVKNTLFGAMKKNGKGFYFKAFKYGLLSVIKL